MNLQFEGIEKFEIQDHLVIINKNQIGKIIIFWKKLEAEKLVVKIQENCNIEILELEEKFMSYSQADNHIICISGGIPLLCTCFFVNNFE